MLLKPKKARKNPHFVSTYQTRYLARNYSYDELLLFDGKIPTRAEYNAARHEVDANKKSPAIL